LILVGAAYAFETQNSNTLTINNTTNTSNDTIAQSNATTAENTTTNTKKVNKTTNSTPNVKISAAESKKLVEQSGQASGVPSSVKSGKPTLVKVSEEYYWKVPYSDDYNYVNANTGDVAALL
jgi:hypothetical protein